MTTKDYHETMALHDMSLPRKREIFEQYQRGERTETEAREIIGEDWNVCVTGSMMARDLEEADWDSLYADEMER